MLYLCLFSFNVKFVFLFQCGFLFIPDFQLTESKPSPGIWGSVVGVEVFHNIGLYFTCDFLRFDVFFVECQLWSQ